MTFLDMRSRLRNVPMKIIACCRSCIFMHASSEDEVCQKE